MLGAHEKPDVSYADVGGLDMQKQEIREAVELPLTHFDLYKQIGPSHPAYSDLDGLTRSRYRPASGSPPVWSSWYWKDDACQGCCQQHDRKLHPGGRF